MRTECIDSRRKELVASSLLNFHCQGLARIGLGVGPLLDKTQSDCKMVPTATNPTNHYRAFVEHLNKLLRAKLASKIAY